jgi:hypothetical protein
MICQDNPLCPLNGAIYILTYKSEFPILRRQRRDFLSTYQFNNSIEDPCSPAESGTGNLPNLLKLVFLSLSLIPALRAGKCARCTLLTQL